VITSNKTLLVHEKTSRANILIL